MKVLYLWNFINGLCVFVCVCVCVCVCAPRMGEERGVYRVLLGKPEGRRQLGRPKRRWVDNIRMDLH